MHEFARYATFDKSEARADAATFDKWEGWFSRQLRVSFQRQQTKQGGREDGLGFGLRFAARSDILLDKDASKVRTTDVQRLSWYPFEKMIRLQEGDHLVIYFRKDNHVLKDLFARDSISRNGAK